MSRKKHFSWMISPKSFISLMGAEYELMQKAGGTVLLKFYLSSVIILIISVVSFCSVRYAIELLFHNLLVETFLSVFLSLLFIVMYIFLINTFTKHSFVDSRKEAVKTTQGLRKHINLSNIARTGFVIFMGFILSKPIEIFVFKNWLKSDLATYKAQVIKVHSEKIQYLFEQDEKKLLKEKVRYESLNRDNSFKDDISRISQALDSIGEKKEKLIATASQRISQSSFFIFRVNQTVGHYKLSWLICLFIIFLFVLPGYLVFSISNEDEYFKMKSTREREMIENSFGAFKEKYSLLFQQEFGYRAAYYSVYLDPPFNTVRKPDQAYKASDDFFIKYLPGN